ncbi:MAG TPA: hydrogenase maturation protease [Syntrophales bacterium]|nr:hydrogenase maturation protease [Syntrophales bacterium]
MSRTLVIGFGNIDRADDGVAYHVINCLRRHLCQGKLHEDETGLEGIGAEVDSIFLVQLTPELIDVVSLYDRIIFVDAHVYENVDSLYCTSVSPEFTPSTFTHHLTPATLLALLKSLLHREPAGHIVSIRGYNFDFHRNLSADTEALVEKAVDHILLLHGSTLQESHPR